jgi:hypothetical protein
MAKLPGHRHRSALDFSQALQRGSLGLPESSEEEPAVPPDYASADDMVEPPSAARPGGRPRRRNWPPAKVAPAGSTPAATLPAATGEVEATPIYRPASPPQPAAGPAFVAPRPAVEEPGWLAPTMVQPPGTDLVPVQPRPRREWVAQQPSRTGRAWLIAAVTVLLTISAVSGVLAFVFANSQPNAPTTPVAAPTDLTIELDIGFSVTLTWTDPTGGQLSYVAEMRDIDGAVLSKSIPPGGGHKSVTFLGLNEAANYCFRVGAVHTSSDVRYTDEVCRLRPTATTP